MAKEVFISYSRDDKALVLPFVKQISKAVKRDCWMDMKGIESGVEFEEVIMKAIDECQIVLFMLSDSSLKSQWTKREVYYAESQQKRIVPVLVNGDKLRGWFQFHFGNVDYINIRSKEHKEKLINNLRDWLGVEEEERKAAEESKKVDHESSANNTPSKREGLLLWIQKRKIWQATAFLTIAAIIGFSVYTYWGVDEPNYQENLAQFQNNNLEYDSIAKTDKVEEEEAKRKAEEEAKQKAEQDAKQKAEQEAKRKAEEEAKQKAEQEAKRKAE